MDKTNPFKIDAPFPWFGGKSRAAALIWLRFGDVPNYVEPFAGSLATLLGRPHSPRAETVNDKDCFVSNFWRVLAHGRHEELAAAADWPVSEADLHSRHLWLVNRNEFRERMLTDPDYCDIKIAGWWVWGLCQWIGGGWCTTENMKRGKPGWNARPQLKNGQGIHKTERGNIEHPTSNAERPTAASRKMPYIAPGGMGVHRKRVNLNRGGRGVLRKRPILKGGLPGVFRTKRQMPTLGGEGSGSGRGVLRTAVDIYEWFELLAERLRRVRVCCGDWKRILGPSPTTHIGMTGVLLDPPYGHGQRYERNNGIYAVDDLGVAAAAVEWARGNGNNPKLRIAVCGYEGEHTMPADWECVAWKAGGGYARGENDNAERERIWFSPHCLKPHEERTATLL